MYDYNNPIKQDEITIIEQSDNGRTRDGRHRVLAYKLLGLNKIKAKYSEIPLLTNAPVLI